MEGLRRPEQAPVCYLESANLGSVCLTPSHRLDHPTIHVSSPSPLSPHSFSPGQILSIFHSSPLTPPPAEAFIFFFLHKSICSVSSLHISTQTFTISFLMIRHVESFFLFISDMPQFKQRVRIKLVPSDQKCRTQNQDN